MKTDRTANLRTNIVGFGGFDSSIILIIGGGIPRPIGNFPESLSQAILVINRGGTEPGCRLAGVRINTEHGFEIMKTDRIILIIIQLLIIVIQIRVTTMITTIIIIIMIIITIT